ncbi:putative histidine kinase, partial [Lachnospiraceae bacterium JC7]
SDSAIKYMTILDENGNILYSNSGLSLDKFREYIDESQDDSNYVNMFRKYKEMKTRVDTATAVFLVVGEILLMLFFVFRINKSVLRPLNLLKSAMEKFNGKENRLKPISYSGPRELEEICESYNDMAEALRKSDEERRRLEEGRERMLAGISHDLKTPVTVIQGYANAILDGTITPRNEMTYVETIFKKSQVLSELINTFHEYSRLEHPDFVLRKTRGDLCEYLREYIANRYDELAIAGFELEVNIPDNGIYAEFDHIELKRVFENLINNTIRHNPKGTTIYVSLEKSDALILNKKTIYKF